MELEIRNGAVGYADRWVLEPMDLRLRPGECVGLIGPNGAGKSTLLRTLAGIQPLRKGTVLLGGKPLKTYPRQELTRQVAYLPQDRPIPFAYTAGDVVLMGRYPHLSWYQQEGENERKLARECLAAVGAENLAHRKMDTLSGGQQQRVLFARTLIQQAAFYLLDEPVAALDLVVEETVLSLCRELARAGRTVLFSVHDLNQAARYCDRLLLVGRNRLLADGIPAEVLTADHLQEAYGVPCRVAGSGGEFRLEVLEPKEEQQKRRRMLQEILENREGM